MPSGFQLADWLVLAAYFLALLGAGAWFSRRKVKGADEYFLGGHAMPVWAVAISILSTAQSAATFVGVPESSFNGDLRYLSSNIGGVLAAIILALVFIPAYYRLGVSTPYQLLETRFGPGAKLAASGTYMVGRIFATGARIFVGALPASFALFGDTDPAHVATVIAAFMILGVAISLVGGISSVIWIDVLQVTVYLGAAVAAIVTLLLLIPLDLSGIFSALAAPPPPAPSKLTVLSFSTDVTEEFTVFTAVFGFTLLTLASHGADQDLVQRMLTCKSAKKGAWSVISGVIVGIPAVLIFLTLGLLLSIFFTRPDIMGSAAPAGGAPKSGEIFQTFALRFMSGWGGAGLVMAGLFAAGPAGINSSLNAMASTLLNDFYKPLRKGRSEKHYLGVGRAFVILWAIILGGFAVVCIYWQRHSGQTLLSFVLAVMSFAYAGLLAVFLTALLTRRGNTASAIAAIAVGFLVVLSFNTPFWVQLAGAWPSLLPSVADAEPAARAAAAKGSLPWLKAAFPWQLCIGTAAAFAVCCLGGPTRKQSGNASPHAAASA